MSRKNATSLMEVSPGDLGLPQPQRALKRSASTASLPTPPRTHRRHKRGRSRGDCDSESDNEAALGNDGAALLSSDEDDEVPRPDRRLHKRRRVSLGRTQSQGRVLASPPPSHRKPQAQAPKTPPVGTPGPSTSAALFRLQSASSPRTPEKQTGHLLRKALKTPEFPIITDSPDNPFYVVPGSPSPGEDSESPHMDDVSPRTPGPAHLEKPTVTYVFRGVRREYRNPLYNHEENRPLSPPSTSLLPIEHPDYSPDAACKPRILFPNARKGKRPADAEGILASGTGSPTALRRSPRRTKVMVRESDDENDRGIQATKAEVLIKPRKLNFGDPKNATGKAKAKAVAESDDVL